MNATTTSREIAAGFAFAGATLCLGFYLSFQAGAEGGTTVNRVFYVLAALIVLKFTFAWGRIRGFPARREDGRIVLSHVMRNVVMSAIVWGALIFFLSPIIRFIFDRAG